MKNRNLKSLARTTLVSFVTLVLPAAIAIPCFAQQASSLNDEVSRILGYPTDSGRILDTNAHFSVRPLSYVSTFPGYSSALQTHVNPALSVLADFGFQKVCHDFEGAHYGPKLPPDASCSGGCSGLERNKQTFLADGYVCQTVTTSRHARARYGHKLTCYDPSLLAEKGDKWSHRFTVTIMTEEDGTYSVGAYLHLLFGVIRRTKTLAQTQQILDQRRNDFACVKLN